MKARIKKTGEIVNLSSYASLTLDMCDSWGNPIELKPEEIELIQDKTDDFDWQSFRAEAVKDFTAALLPVIDWEHTYNENIIKQAIDLANELIKQLKEKEEK